MRVIVAGTRDLATPRAVLIRLIAALAETLPGRVGTVLSGASGVVDRAGEAWAGGNVERFPADWQTHGRGAGPIRNQQMVGSADALILVWDGRSRGSADVLQRARAAGLAIRQAIVE